MSATYIHTKHKAGLAPIILRCLGYLYFIGVAAAIIYLWCFTQNRFVSAADFKISSQDSSSAAAGIVSLALPGLTDSGSMDSQVAIGYINSTDLLLQLEKEKEFNLVEHYSSPSRDLIFRLAPNASLEDRLKYYRNRIYAHFDKDTGLTELTVDTFNPELSQKIAKYILKKSEVFMNTINQSIADQQLSFVRSEVDRTTKQVDDLNKELITLQNAHNFITPDEVISASLKAVETLRMQHLQAEAELSSLLRDSPNSPRIETVRSQLRSLSELIDIESAKLSGSDRDRLNQLLIQFNELKAKFDFAISLRAGALAMLEKTRSSTIAQSRFFSVIQNPYLPQDVAIPQRPYATITILVLGVLLFLIFRALTNSIFERA